MRGALGASGCATSTPTRPPSVAARPRARPPAAAALRPSLSSASPPLSSIDNAAAQSAAAIDVEFAHYELQVHEDEEGADAMRMRGKGRAAAPAAAAVSVAAAVAVVARRWPQPLGAPPGPAEEAAEGWRAGLDVLYHARYIQPSQEELERAAAGIRGRWAWVGGVRPPPLQPPPPPSLPPKSGEPTTATPTTTLAEARRDVLMALEGRGVVVMHGADHDLRSLGLESLLLPPQTGAAAARRAPPVVVADTSALPPLTNRSSGAPRSLRRLAKEYLARDIQGQAGALHDPVEDAAVALDLWLDVAWPRALLDRQQRQQQRQQEHGVSEGSDGADAAAAAALVEALGATLAREVAQGRRTNDLARDRRRQGD